jgi:hypothetical protein
MAGQNDNPNTPNSQDSGNGGEKLIFGKYKTMDEAEKGYKSLEKDFHESRETVKRFDERFDALESRLVPADDGYGRGGYAPAPREDYRAPAATDQSQTLQRFYQNPQEVLNEVEERAAARVRRESDVANRNQRVVNEWLSKNQDVSAYPELLTYWVGQQDQRLAPQRKLEEAAKMVRQRITEIKGTRETPEPKPGDIIESPGSTAPGGKAPAAAAPSSSESQLGSYVAQRNNSARKPLNTKRG